MTLRSLAVIKSDIKNVSFCFRFKHVSLYIIRLPRYIDSCSKRIIIYTYIIVVLLKCFFFYVSCLYYYIKINL